jgi:hypothetical protein
VKHVRTFKNFSSMELLIVYVGINFACGRDSKLRKPGKDVNYA